MKPPRQREPRLACLCLLPLALAACQGKETTKEAAPQGEVLPGSVSDAMLPLDTVRSQPPFAPQTEAAVRPAKGASGGGATEAAGDGESDAEAPAAAAPSPAPAVTPDAAP